MALLAMKVARKAMKSKRVSKVAKGRGAKAQVLKGKKEKTVGGLKRDDLIRNKRGKVVSKRACANGKRRYRQIEDWVEALMAARSALHVQGFVAVNGKTLQGKALYAKTKALVSARNGGAAMAAPVAGAAPAGQVGNA
mmetsp:Transcript_51954/g.111121  ORF Transcript_51954/g.111121 Transcript_51954/m.111121 type:complete len:138 (-) Transcript_51954:134-547(-)